MMSPMIIRTLDAHTAGEPLRLIVDGYPSVEGQTMLEKRAWVEEHCDHLRTALMLEPRGHADMVLDTPAGQIHAAAKVDRSGIEPRVTGVSFRNVPSFVLAAGVPVRLG